MNNNISKIHLDILDKKRQEVLEKIIPLVRDFTLGGGTALALQLKHRVSFDFDFFSPKTISKNLLEKISNVVDVGSIAIDKDTELTFFTKEDIKITFLHYPFSPIYDDIVLESGLKIFPIKQIAVNKAYTVGRRGEYRDYFDIYSILTNDFFTLPLLISETKKMYGTIFDEKMFLEQLVYFKDLLEFNVTPVPGFSIQSHEVVEQYLQEIVRIYTSSL